MAELEAPANIGLGGNIHIPGLGIMLELEEELTEADNVVMKDEDEEKKKKQDEDEGDDEEADEPAGDDEVVS